jgi:hypothetical protein
MVEYRTFRGAMPRLIVIVVARGSGEMLAKIQYQDALRRYEAGTLQYLWETGRIENHTYYRILVKRC